MITSEKAVETVQALDRAYPNGWRCGHTETDVITVILANGIREFTKAIFQAR